MRKVDLRMNEQFKYVVIKKLVDSNGNKKNAAIKLNCSLRTVNRLIIKYKMEGKLGFVHKNRPNTSALISLISLNFLINMGDSYQ